MTGGLFGSLSTTRNAFGLLLPSESMLWGVVRMRRFDVNNDDIYTAYAKISKQWSELKQIRSMNCLRDDSIVEAREVSQDS